MFPSFPSQLELPVIDLGLMTYAQAYEIQLAHHAEVLSSRETPTPFAGRLLLVEHDPPVITISRRADARAHLLASEDQLTRSGVSVAETDRGGDITYHGPGQLVAYPILDLNFFKLGLHDYMRLLEQAVIDTIAMYGIAGRRDAAATGVWVGGDEPVSPAPLPDTARKIAAMGVRVRRWVSLHGLAINHTTNLDHFNLIVPCGLAGKGVTSLRREFDTQPTVNVEFPTMTTVKRDLASMLREHLRRRLGQVQSASPSGEGERPYPRVPPRDGLP